MLNHEKEACSILDVAAAALSLAYNMISTNRVKHMIPKLYNEMVALRNEIDTHSGGYEAARLKAIMDKITIYKENSSSTQKLATNRGSAALDLACAYVKHAALLVSSDPQGANKLTLDYLGWLADTIHTLAREEESPNAMGDM